MPKPGFRRIPMDSGNRRAAAYAGKCLSGKPVNAPDHRPQLPVQPGIHQWRAQCIAVAYVDPIALAQKLAAQLAHLFDQGILHIWGNDSLGPRPGQIWALLGD